MSISAEQTRAARALLGWSQDDLSNFSGVAKTTLANFEAGRRQPYTRTLREVRSALERAGVQFIAVGEASNAGGAGVRVSVSGDAV